MLRAGLVSNGKRLVRVIPSRVSYVDRRNLFGRAWRCPNAWANEVEQRMEDHFRRAERDLERTMERFFPPSHSVRGWPWRDWYFTEPTARVLPVEKGDDAGKIFRLRLDVSGCKPEEIRVKVKEGGIVEIKARRESADGGEGSACKLSKEAQWEYLLPKDVEEETIQSFLSSDGILTLEAQRKLPKEKEIPIQQQKTPEQKTE